MTRAFRRPETHNRLLLTIFKSAFRAFIKLSNNRLCNIIADFLVPRNDQINKHKYTFMIILLKHTSCFPFECKACKHHVWSGRRSEDWGLWSGHQWWWWWRENSVQRNSFLHGSWTSEMIYTDNNVYFLCFIG